MKISLAERLQGVSESSTLKMNALAREMSAKGLKVVNLTAGEPDFPVLPEVKKELIAAVNSDFSKYTAVGGIPELKTAVAKKFKDDNGLTYAPEQILVSVGAKHSIFNFLLATISPGDEVIIPAPYWVSYPEMVRLAGGKPVILETKQSDKFKLDPAKLKAAITSKTKAFIFNSPSNPTGTVYSKSEIEKLAKVFEGTSVIVLSDEIYEKLIYSDEKFASFASFSKDAYERTVTVNGVSKAYAMTGYRLGYAAGPKEIIAAMTLIQGQSTSNPTSIVQKAAIKALSLPDSDIQPMCEAFSKRRNRMAEILSQSKNCSFSAPEGAFYFFVNVERLLGATYNIEEKSKSLSISIVGSEDLAFFLLEQAQVVTVPGTGFGAPGYLRLSFAVSDADVVEGAQRFVKALDGLQRI